MTLKDLKNYENDYLNITEEEEILGYKYVYQTKLTKSTIGERIRAPVNMWSIDETFIDNNLDFVIERLNDFYN